MGDGLSQTQGWSSSERKGQGWASGLRMAVAHVESTIITCMILLAPYLPYEVGRTSVPCTELDTTAQGHTRPGTPLLMATLLANS